MAKPTTSFLSFASLQLRGAKAGYTGVDLMALLQTGLDEGRLAVRIEGLPHERPWHFLSREDATGLRLASDCCVEDWWPPSDRPRPIVLRFNEDPESPGFHEIAGTPPARRSVEFNGHDFDARVDELRKIEAPVIQHTGGRPPVWDWEGAVMEACHMLVYARSEVTVAHLVAHVRDWFMHAHDNAPDDKSIRRRCKRVRERFAQE